MFVRKKFSVADDGHNMGLVSEDGLETMAEEAVDENIEKDHSVERKLLESGKTKRKMSTRRSSDNVKKKIKEILRMRYELERNQVLPFNIRLGALFFIRRVFDCYFTNAR